ncbi:MAG: hypothetical protein WKF77_23515 [Planctomycetaceae bacterium]
MTAFLLCETSNDELGFEESIAPRCVLDWPRTLAANYPAVTLAGSEERTNTATDSLWIDARGPPISSNSRCNGLRLPP